MCPLHDVDRIEPASSHTRTQAGNRPGSTAATLAPGPKQELRSASPAAHRNACTGLQTLANFLARKIAAMRDRNIAPFGAMEDPMPVARVTEIISASTTSFEDAIQQGIARAVKTLDNVEGAWVKEQKVVVEDGEISEYRVDLKVTFILTD
jgi:flavin-binding protein dodecin